ncbi:hypothetical protein SCP_1701250 [Sparassis crispa]|uniref:Uncharacterized protein n=1 Tax=Sparassis crispa TaxID=139825 RepID=A0A401H615_9APHY|nr:hypothetical protein SCP_1701250 [Sparassis crispa]GBE89800.1 hypothetical protein SCP_1701250 [Sparassis crispa]
MKVTACPRQCALTHRNDIPAVLDHRALNANVNLTVFHQVSWNPQVHPLALSALCLVERLLSFAQVQVIENRAGALQVQLWFMLTNPNIFKRPSEVTLRRYSRATPEEEHHIEVSRTPSHVSAQRLVYEEADRPTPGITRVSTQRTARTARTEPIAPPVEEEEEDIPHISVVIHSVEHVPTASRPRAGIPSVAVVPPEEAEEPYLPEELPAEPGVRGIYTYYYGNSALQTERFGELEQQLTGTIDALRDGAFSPFYSSPTITGTNEGSVATRSTSVAFTFTFSSVSYNECQPEHTPPRGAFPDVDHRDDSVRGSSTILTRDVNRLLQNLHNADAVIREENRE